HPLSRDTVPNVCPGRPLGADRRSSLPRSEAWLTGNDLWSENRKVCGSTPPLATSSRHLRRDIFATRKPEYTPCSTFRRTPAERADQELSWRRGDQAFFGSNAQRAAGCAPEPSALSPAAFRCFVDACAGRGASRAQAR